MTYLKKLREVYLNKNSLWSDLPPDVGMMEDLEDIRLGENRMYGTIPDSFYNLVKMKKIWLQDTVECSNVTGDCQPSSSEGFEGSLQTQIGNMEDLTMLVLNNNPLTGTLPTELGNCKQLCESGIYLVPFAAIFFRSLILLLDLQPSFTSIRPTLKVPFPNQSACSVTKC